LIFLRVIQNNQRGCFFETRHSSASHMCLWRSRGMVLSQWMKRRQPRLY